MLALFAQGILLTLFQSDLDCVRPKLKLSTLVEVVITWNGKFKLTMLLSLRRVTGPFSNHPSFSLFLCQLFASEHQRQLEYQKDHSGDYHH